MHLSYSSNQDADSLKASTQVTLSIQEEGTIPDGTSDRYWAYGQWHDYKGTKQYSKTYDGSTIIATIPYSKGINSSSFENSVAVPPRIGPVCTGGNAPNSCIFAYYSTYSVKPQSKYTYSVTSPTGGELYRGELPESPDFPTTLNKSYCNKTYGKAFGIGEYVMVDLGTKLFILQYIIKTDEIVGSPVNMRIYASNDAACWTNTMNSSFQLISSVNEMKYSKVGDIYQSTGIINYDEKSQPYNVIEGKVQENIMPDNIHISIDNDAVIEILTDMVFELLVIGGGGSGGTRNGGGGGAGACIYLKNARYTSMFLNYYQIHSKKMYYIVMKNP